MSIETLEPLLAAVTANVHAKGWRLSGVQKTTSYEYEGPWEGSALRSAYAFFHRGADPEGVGPSVEVFIDETEEGVDGALSLLLQGPALGEEPDVPALVSLAVELAAQSLPREMPAPISVTYSHPGRKLPDSATAKVRFKGKIPRSAAEAGTAAVDAVLNTTFESFQDVLHRWPYQKP
ncbi:MAG: hypothetical protein ACR2QM_15585 [Longimicrobiales bacterium]